MHWLLGAAQVAAPQDARLVGRGGETSELVTVRGLQHVCGRYRFFVSSETGDYLVKSNSEALIHHAMAVPFTEFGRKYSRRRRCPP